MQTRKKIYTIAAVALMAVLLAQAANVSAGNRAIDGTARLSAQTDVEPGDWQIVPIGESEFERGAPSLALDANGHPHIAYYDVVNRDIEYTYYDGAVWHAEVVYSSGDNYTPILALDSNDNPHIVWDYYNAHNVMYAYKDGPTWHIETVHAGVWPKALSLAVDSNDQPHVSYWTDGRGDDVTYAWRTGGVWSTRVVEHTSHTPTHTALTVDTLDNIHIAYSLYGAKMVKYARFDGDWYYATVISSSAQIHGPVSIDTDTFNQPHIMHRNDTLDKVDYYHWQVGNNWPRETVVDQAHGYIALKLDSLDQAHLVYSYYDETGYYIRYIFQNGSQWNPAEGVSTGWSFSLALDASDTPHIGFYDYLAQDVYYASRVINPINAFVVLGAEGVWLKQNSTIVNGDVGANSASDGPYLGSGSEMIVGENSTLTTRSSWVTR